MPHRFRFFISSGTASADVREGRLLTLTDEDAAHLRVLRMKTDDVIELVAPDVLSPRGWLAKVHDVRRGEVRVVETMPIRAETQIELIAGSLGGSAFDELIDAATQAGATRIVPFATGVGQIKRIDERRVRLERCAYAAAKQAKRSLVPEIAAAVTIDEVVEGDAGIVCDAVADVALTDIDLPPRGSVIRLLVGSADGIQPNDQAQLIERGWRVARLGPTILRSELAAAVAVATLNARATER
jgi:16S rRNA (uracil1498-N3)-methyltransferase